MLNDRRDESCELGLLPSLLIRELRVDKVETVKSVRILDSTEHVDSAFAACMSQNDGFGIDDLKLRPVLLDGHVVAGNDADNGEERAGRLPALRAAACVVVGNVALETDDDFIRGAATKQIASREVRVPFGDTIVDERVDRRHDVCSANSKGRSSDIGLLKRQKSFWVIYDPSLKCCNPLLRMRGAGNGRNFRDLG